MWNRLDRGWRRGLTVSLVLVALLVVVGAAVVADEPSFQVTDAVPAPLYSATAPTAGSLELAAARWAIAGPLAYDDLTAVEREARAKLKHGLDVREALSPYRGRTEFQAYVRELDISAGWQAAAGAVGYEGDSPYHEPLSLAELINRADQDLRAARDLYAFLAVFAPEARFRQDGYYITDTHDVEGFPGTLCGAANKEDPNPLDPAHTGQVLAPVIDWCDFRSRLRQSVREAANLRLIYGQEFMVDAMGLHFSGNFVGGENAVRGEIAQLDAARYQFELAEVGLAEALDRAVGNGCRVSDFYTQNEWALLSRAAENQETAQHHIAVRMSYMGAAGPESVPQVHAQALEAYRAAASDGYLKLIGLAGLANAPDTCVTAGGQSISTTLVADVALGLMETRRSARQMNEGRNIFGFNTTFTPARNYRSSDPMNCDTLPVGERGLWDEAWCAAKLAESFQDIEKLNTRDYEQSQAALRDEVRDLQRGVDQRIANVSGCANTGNDDAWYACVAQQRQLLTACLAKVGEPYEPPAADPFGVCMADARIKNGAAKQALVDLRGIYLQQYALAQRAENMNQRVQLSKDANATVTDWLHAKGAAETAARVAQATADMVNNLCSPDKLVTGAAVGIGISGGANIAAQLAAGIVSMEADVQIADAENHKEVQNLLLDMSELLIDAYAAAQQFQSKYLEYEALLDGMMDNLTEAQRQRAHFQALPANDPSYRLVRDSSRMQFAQQMDYAARSAYLAARRAEYEYAARLYASNFRISDIYRARTAQDIQVYLTTLAGLTGSMPTSPASADARAAEDLAAAAPATAHLAADSALLNLSVAQHVLQLTDAALEKEGYTDPAAREAERVQRFRAWVAEHTTSDTLSFAFATSLLDGGFFQKAIGPGYDSVWLLKLAGIGAPLANCSGLSVNLVTAQPGNLVYRQTRITHGGTVHLRSHAGCIFDYKLIAPAVLMGYEWPENQPAESAIGTPNARVNLAYGQPAWAEAGYATGAFEGRPVSATDWQVTIYAAPPGNPPGLIAMDLQQLKDIELILSITKDSRLPTEPSLGECTRIDW